MTLERISMSALEPVSLQDMKAHLRLEHDEEDVLLSDMIIAARQFLENRLSLAFITSRWRYRPRHAFTDEGKGSRNAQIKMPLFPIYQVDHIKLFLADGTTAFADLTHTRIETAQRPAFLSDMTLPSTLQPNHSVEIEFSAGYGAAAEDVPVPLRLAIKLLAAYFYENRIDLIACQAVSMPASVSMLLMSYMEVRLK